MTSPLVFLSKGATRPNPRLHSLHTQEREKWSMYLLDFTTGVSEYRCGVGLGDADQGLAVHLNDLVVHLDPVEQQEAAHLKVLRSDRHSQRSTAPHFALSFQAPAHFLL